jgi:hypothetical protein
MHVGNLATLYRSIFVDKRVSSFYWIRGSKNCVLTSFSYLNCYFLFLVFLSNCYILVSLRLSRLHENPISCPIFSYLWYFKVLHCTCVPIFLAHIMHFLKARCLWEPGIRISTGFLSPFRHLPNVSHANVHWSNANHAFLLGRIGIARTCRSWTDGLEEPNSHMEARGGVWEFRGSREQRGKWE